MDLIDCDQTALYFDDPLAPKVEDLIAIASECYGEAQAEFYLLRAYFLAPEQLTVLVALYRYYFYQHRLEDAHLVATRTLAAASQRLGFTTDWQHLQPTEIEQIKPHAVGLLRFYLLALKASAYLHLRLGNHHAGHTQLEKLVQLDCHDQLGGQALLKLAHLNEATSTTA
jgi:small-conductance mechanosensitive channel